MRKFVVYYMDEKGRNPVWEFIQNLPPDERDKCLEVITYLGEVGEQIRRPIGDYIGNKLYELRPKQSRVLYFFMLRDYAVLVHAFRKKTDALPKKELRTALENMRDFIHRYNLGLLNLEKQK
ncbi:MAG TPA: type II toxin-antitoxin system RelE/ParE family toxin [Candidatus Omnitrophota bacterium]|nr:type II toxin-antitoxin system RelE/ParE family toxin [Candidatus Omnitrophota bacterium]